MKENLAKKIGSTLTPYEVLYRVVEGCAEAKGNEITALDVSKLSDLAEYFVVVSGRSDRQTQGIVNRVIATLEEVGISPRSIEGFEDGHWILVDFGDVVLHAFYEASRKHYNIESLWSRAERVTVKKPRRSRKNAAELHAA